MDQSQSQSQKPSYYDVFLSFRGVDTRKTFLSHLDKALTIRGFHIFKDDRELKIGESLHEALSKANRKSSCAVVVMSENYADSSWCLDELRLIMELQEKKEIEVVPIFYGVIPSDVRHQQGKFSLEMYQGAIMVETVLGWRKALTDIANLKGMVSTQFDDDAAMVEATVRRISSRLLTLSPINFDDFVGMEARMEGLRPHLGMDSKDDARFVGIFGMGGIGKTAIASYIYEKHKRSFSHCYFMENVAKLSREHGLLELQRRMLSRILGEDNLKLESVEQGRQQLELRLRNLDFFLVLDNVDNLNQLSALAKEIRWFGPGSRIIITTRDRSLLNSCGKFVYDVECLNDDEARELFKKIGIKGQHPPLSDIENLSNHVIRLAKGLPLALKALGTSLCATKDWKEALRSLERVPYINLDKILKSNFASLDEPGKTAFLNIAHLINRDPLWRVTTLLEGVVALAKKSLIDISADGRIIMRESIKKIRSPVSPAEEQILRCPEDINAIIADTERKSRIQSVVLKDSVERLDFLEWKHFEQMHNLKFLMIYQYGEGLYSRRYQNLKGNFLLPCNLKILHWDAYPFTTLPSIMSLNCLVEVNLCYSKLIRLWSGTPRLLHLKKLDLTGSKDLKELPDLQEAASLEKLMLEGCISQLGWSAWIFLMQDRQ